MKYLLIVVILIAAVFIWRNNRKTATTLRKAEEARAKTVDMLACRWCGVHIPATDAETGRNGSYCSISHQLKAEPH